MAHWAWIDSAVALAAHAEQLHEHGGGHGTRDAGALESVLARPRNLAAYDEPDAASLAAGYTFRIARNHPFVDGNKRTAAVVSETFLIRNGYVLNATDAELVVVFLALAAARFARRRWRTGSAGTSPPPDQRNTRPIHSAVRAGLSSASISTATWWTNCHWPGRFSSTLVSVKRPRTRLPERTGAMKRTLSKP